MKVEFIFFDANETEYMQTFEDYAHGHSIRVGDRFLFREVFPGLQLEGFTDDPDVEHLLKVESRIWNIVEDKIQIFLEK